MSTFRSTGPLLGTFAAIAAAAVLAGCSGSPSQFSPASTQTNSAAVLPITPDAQQCRQQGGVRVTPCRVEFTVSNEGPTSLSVRTPHGSKGEVVEHDSCGGASGIASFSGSGSSWSVTAGAKAGNCKARFNYSNNGKKVGFAVLKVDNDI